MADKTESILPYGTKVEISEDAVSDLATGLQGTMVDISAVTRSFSMSGAQADEIANDSFASVKTGFKSYVQGLKDPGTISFDGYFTPKSDEHKAIKKAYEDGKLRALQLTLPDGTKEQMLCFVRAYPFNIGLDNVITSTIELRLSGEIKEVSA